MFQNSGDRFRAVAEQGKTSTITVDTVSVDPSYGDASYGSAEYDREDYDDSDAAVPLLEAWVR